MIMALQDGIRESINNGVDPRLRRPSSLLRKCRTPRRSRLLPVAAKGNLVSTELNSFGAGYRLLKSGFGGKTRAQDEI